MAHAHLAKVRTSEQDVVISRLEDSTYTDSTFPTLLSFPLYVLLQVSYMLTRCLITVLSRNLPCLSRPKMVSSISQHALLTGREVCRAAIESVSPRQLVWGSVNVVEKDGSTMINVGGREYPLDQ